MEKINHTKSSLDVTLKNKKSQDVRQYDTLCLFVPLLERERLLFPVGTPFANLFVVQFAQRRKL
jgi:hypothetical protein